MITIDQLRISDDGKKLYIDAHVNKAKYFDNVYLDEVTVCTGEQLEENCFTPEEDNYVYKTKVSTVEKYMQAADSATVLSASELLEKQTEDGGLLLNVPTDTSSTGLMLPFMLGGKFSAFSNKQPVLIFTNDKYSVDEGISGDNVLYIVKGKPSDKGDTDSLYTFRDKARLDNIGDTFKMYLFAKEDNNVTQIKFDATDDKEFLHLAYLPYFIAGKEAGEKEVHLVLCAQDFSTEFCHSDLSSDMFFVYFKTKGVPAPDTPCRFDEMTTVGVTLDYGEIFNKAMCYVKQLGERCTVSQNFIDFILHLNALKLAIETEHYPIAFTHFNYLKGKESDSTSYRSSCGCR